MTQRLHDWGQLWQIRQTDQPHERPSLQEQAKQQAQQLEPLTIGQLAWVLKHLPDKACGPDAVTAQLLRNAPPLALQPLLKLFQEMETQAQLPTQEQMHMVIMLPKTSTKERPITLTSLLYRAWRRLRKPLLDHGRNSYQPQWSMTEHAQEPKSYRWLWRDCCAKRFTEPMDATGSLA